MKMTKPGNPPGTKIFVGTCSHCKAEFEATKAELHVETCPREHYEFARVKCTCCGFSLIMYPRKGANA